MKYMRPEEYLVLNLLINYPNHLSVRYSFDFRHMCQDLNILSIAKLFVFQRFI